MIFDGKKFNSEEVRAIVEGLDRRSMRKNGSSAIFSKDYFTYTWMSCTNPHVAYVTFFDEGSCPDTEAETIEVLEDRGFDVAVVTPSYTLVRKHRGDD